MAYKFTWVVGHLCPMKFWFLLVSNLALITCIEFLYPFSFSPLSQEYVENGLLDSLEEDTHALQFQQWTVPQFCFSLLGKVIALLKVPSEEVIREGIKILQMTTKLLRNVVIAERLWSDESVIAKQLVRKFLWGEMYKFISIFSINRFHLCYECSKKY